MRIEITPTTLRVVLSERNLKTLLSKLTMPDSACTICTSLDGAVFYVSAEPDDQHYNGREPGPMHPATEAQIKEE